MRHMLFQELSQSDPSEPLLDETFNEDCRTGRVLGTRSSDGWLRLGVDRERRIGIDHGALRFQPVIRPGWGRQGIAYGPFTRRAGLCLAVAITNGHNTSQSSSISEGILRRLWRWVRGPGADPIPKRLRALLLGPRKKGLLRRFINWLRLSPRFYGFQDMDENLAIGWFASPAPTDPRNEGCGFVVHAALGLNGELWARSGSRNIRCFPKLRNVRVYYFVVLRDRGAIYYAAAGPDAAMLPAMPMMRPIAVDSHDEQHRLYAGVHQAVLGQVGFRVDTRVHGLRVCLLPDLAEQAPGQVSDTMVGEGPLSVSSLNWRVLRGNIRRTGRGAAVDCGEALAVVDGLTETGLIHVMLATTEAAGEAGLIWRFLDMQNYWALELSARGAVLVRYDEGKRRVLALDSDHVLVPGSTVPVQISDAAGQVGCSLGGVLLFGGWVDAVEDSAPAGVGVWMRGGTGTTLRNFECHPRAVPVPEELRFPEPWRRFGTEVLCSDDFFGPAGELDGRMPALGSGRWARYIGRGVLDVAAPQGAKVRASLATPNPGRTFHILPWAHESFADIESVILPPGTARGQKEHCRCGLVLWQDEDNYLSFTAYLADEYDGASVALFTKRHGFEELYDAIWTMVDDKIVWGRPFRLRIACDGLRFVVVLDGETIMERSLVDLYPDDPPLKIRGVGLATNWEWGDDTGSAFQQFIARA